MSAKNKDDKNRWRNKNVGFRCSPEEGIEIDKRWKMCGFCTKQDYILECLLHPYLIARGNPMMLEEDGSNIANILQLILKSKLKKKKLLNLLCDSLPFIEQIDVQNNVDKSVSYRIKEKYNNKTFYSNFLSDGTVNMLALIIALYFEGESGIIIIEEPERNLHPQLMSKIVEMAKEVSREKQIIITTHNPELVKYSDVNDILFAKRTIDGFTQISKPSDNFMVQQFIDSDLGIDDLFVNSIKTIKIKPDSVSLNNEVKCWKPVFMWISGI